MSLAVVVGHGRSPEGKGWGPRIDAARCVIRMWDWGWQDAADYGTRYDYGVIEIGTGLIEKAMKHKRSDPAKGWIASLLHGKPSRLPPNSEIVDQKRWNDIGRRLGGAGATGRLQFTRGTIATCWAIEQERWSEIVLVGFDVILAGKTLGTEKDFSPAYRKNPGTFSFSGWRANTSKFGNHDFKVERKVIATLAEEHGVRVNFAQEVW